MTLDQRHRHSRLCQRSDPRRTTQRPRRRLTTAAPVLADNQGNPAEQAIACIGGGNTWVLERQIAACPDGRGALSRADPDVDWTAATVFEALEFA